MLGIVCISWLKLSHRHWALGRTNVDNFFLFSLNSLHKLGAGKQGHLNFLKQNTCLWHLESQFKIFWGYKSHSITVMEHWTLPNFRTGGGVKAEVIGEKEAGRPAWWSPEQKAGSQEAVASSALPAQDKALVGGVQFLDSEEKLLVAAFSPHKTVRLTSDLSGDYLSRSDNHLGFAQC